MRRDHSGSFLASALVVIAAVTAVPSGCSSGGSTGAGRTTESPASRPTSSPTRRSTTDRPPATTATSPATTSTATTSTATTGTSQPSRPSGAEAIQFRPVLGSQPCSAVTPDPSAGAPSSETTVATNGRPEVFEATDGGLCYGLGPVAADGTELTSAMVSKGPIGWQVIVEPSIVAVAKLNFLFDRCYAGTSSCPATEGGHGLVAIVVDGKVASAPSIQATDLASKPFQISGSFTEAEARSLAKRLNT